MLFTLRCVPYYGCKGGELIVNGEGIVDIRNMDPLNSKCPGDLEVCCRHPDWRNVPIETIVTIKKPQIVCKTDLEVLVEKEISSCTKNGLIYKDLEKLRQIFCNLISLITNVVILRPVQLINPSREKRTKKIAFFLLK